MKKQYVLGSIIYCLYMEDYKLVVEEMIVVKIEENEAYPYIRVFSNKDETHYDLIEDDEENLVYINNSELLFLDDVDINLKSNFINYLKN